MFALPSFLAPVAVYCRVLNTLLRREDWARERLARHAGKTVRFMVGGYSLSLSIQATGLVQPSEQAIVPDVTLTIPANRMADLPAVLRARDPSRLTELLHVQGDAGLAQVVSDLARDLRWDIEEDLSRIVGDVAALRLMQAGSVLAAGAQTAAQRLAGNASEFLSEESGILVNRPAYEDWADHMQALGGRLDQLERRVAELASSASRGV